MLINIDIQDSYRCCKVNPGNEDRFAGRKEQMASHAEALWDEASFVLDFFGSFWGPSLPAVRNAKKNEVKLIEFFDQIIIN